MGWCDYVSRIAPRHASIWCECEIVQERITDLIDHFTSDQLVALDME